LLTSVEFEGTGQLYGASEVEAGVAGVAGVAGAVTFAEAPEVTFVEASADGLAVVSAAGVVAAGVVAAGVVAAVVVAAGVATGVSAAGVATGVSAAGVATGVSAAGVATGVSAAGLALDSGAGVTGVAVALVDCESFFMFVLTPPTTHPPSGKIFVFVSLSWMSPSYLLTPDLSIGSVQLYGAYAFGMI